MTQTPILLFAAGLGTRMGALTKDRPKPLVEVGGRALLDHALDFALIPEVGPRVVNIHYLPQMMRDHLRDRDVLISDESDRLLETGGGLKKAHDLLGGTSPVLTMNTDAVWKGPNPIPQLLKAWRPEMEALLLVVPRANAHAHRGKGDFSLDGEGRLHRAPEHVYTGVQMIRCDRLDEVGDDAFSMNEYWNRMDARGGLYGTLYDGEWCDVGHPGALPEAEAMLDV